MNKYSQIIDRYIGDCTEKRAKIIHDFCVAYLNENWKLDIKDIELVEDRSELDKTKWYFRPKTND